MRDLSPYFLALVVLPLIAVIALAAHRGKLDHEARKVARIHAAHVAAEAAQVAEAARRARQYAALERIDEALVSPR